MSGLHPFRTRCKVHTGIDLLSRTGGAHESVIECCVMHQWVLSGIGVIAFEVPHHGRGVCLGVGGTQEGAKGLQTVEFDIIFVDDPHEGCLGNSRTVSHHLEESRKADVVFAQLEQTRRHR
jgi:hypothetical protein